MTKKMRELQTKILQKTNEAQTYMEGEHKDVDKAAALIAEAEGIQKELDALTRITALEKGGVPEVQDSGSGEVSGFTVLNKMMRGQRLNDEEKALITGTGAQNGENNLVPEDVHAEINERRRSYISAKDVVTVETTEAMSGSFNYETGEPAGLTDFDDGNEIPADDKPKFDKKTFTVKLAGKLIPVSRILLGKEKAGLMAYLDRWFIKNAVISENKKIFDTLKAGYQSGSPKAIAGWKALKKSINKDLDPAVKLNGVIVTNQSGFAALDEEEDKNGRPILQPNPANPTEKMFQGLPIRVFSDAQLPNIDGTHFPVIYGDTKAGCTFVEGVALQFDISEHYLFSKNQNCLRVVEGFDVISTDTEAYIYGSFEASAASMG